MTLRDDLNRANLIWFIRYCEELEMAKACKFCVRMNSFVCGDPDDCCDCGACKSKESKENG